MNKNNFFSTIYSPVYNSVLNTFRLIPDLIDLGGDSIICVDYLQYVSNDLN